MENVNNSIKTKFLRPIKSTLNLFSITPVSDLTVGEEYVPQIHDGRWQRIKQIHAMVTNTFEFLKKMCAISDHFVQCAVTF